MAYKFDGTNQYVSADSGASNGSTPMTLAVRFRPLSILGESVVRVPLALSDNATSGRAALLYRYVNTWHAWHSNQQAGLTGMTFEVWTSGVGLFSSTTSRQAYINASASTTDTLSTNAVSANRTTIGAWFNGATVQGYANDDIAEAAIWTVVLNADEITSLSKGFRPNRIRPQSLVFYAPLVRNLQDVRAGLALTNNNSATVADHPRVY